MGRLTKFLVDRGNGSLALIDDPNELKVSEPYALNPENTHPEYYWGIYSPKKGLIKSERLYTSIIDGNLAAQMGLEAGDKIRFIEDHHNKIINIEEINDTPVSTIKAKPIILRQANYSPEASPIDSFGFPSLRVATGQAPPSGGANVYIQGPGGSGKSSLLMELAEAYFRLTCFEPITVILYQVGERNKDAGIYETIYDNVPHQDSVEIYKASVGIVKGQNMWHMFEWLIARARALARHHKVVLIIDSLHPLVEARSRLPVENDGMFSGGLYTEALYEVRDRISVTGYYGDTWLSIYSALLGNYQERGVTGGLDELAKRTFDNVPDVVWSLVANGSLQYPRIDVDSLRFNTRRQGTFADPRLIAEQQAVEALKWNRDSQGKAQNRAEVAHAATINYYLNNLIPPWAKYPPNDGKPIVPHHLRMMNADIEIPDQLAYLTSPEITEKIRHFASSRGLPESQIIGNALELYLRALEAETQGHKVFLGSKPGDEVAQITLTPRVSPKPLT